MKREEEHKSKFRIKDTRELQICTPSRPKKPTKADYLMSNSCRIGGKNLFSNCCLRKKYMGSIKSLWATVDCFGVFYFQQRPWSVYSSIDIKPSQFQIEISNDFNQVNCLAITSNTFEPTRSQVSPVWLPTKVLRIRSFYRKILLPSHGSRLGKECRHNASNSDNHFFLLIFCCWCYLVAFAHFIVAGSMAVIEWANISFRP